MAENVTLNAGSGGSTLAADEIAGVHYQRVKITLGADGAADLDVDSGQQTMANSLPVVLASDHDDIKIADGGNNISVDWGGTVPPIGAGTEAAALRVTLATDSTGLISIDDNGGALTVDNAGTFAVQVDGDALTALQLIDDVVYAEDVAHSESAKGILVHGVRDDELATQAADGDYNPLRTDQFGRLRVTNLGDATSAVKFGVIDDATSGDNTLQAAAGAGIKIRVLALFMISAGTATARFESGTGGTALTGQMTLVANSGFTLPYNPEGWFETADNTLLNLELSAAVSMDGCFAYVEV